MHACHRKAMNFFLIVLLGIIIIKAGQCDELLSTVKTITPCNIRVHAICDRICEKGSYSLSN